MIAQTRGDSSFSFISSVFKTQSQGLVRFEYERGFDRIARVVFGHLLKFKLGKIGFDFIQTLIDLALSE